MLKWIGRLILIGFIVSVIMGVVLFFNAKATVPPSTEDAPYAVQCYYIDKHGLKVPTRYYYVEAFEMVDGQVVMKVYWAFDGQRYHKKSGERAVSKPYEVIRR